MSSSGQCSDHATADIRPRLLLLCGNLIDVSRITGTAMSLGIAVDTASDVTKMRSLLETGGYGFCLIDLALPQIRIADVLAAIPETASLRTIAFGPHVQTARLDEARTAGCDQVLPRSRFFAMLPDILISGAGHDDND